MLAWHHERWPVNNCWFRIGLPTLVHQTQLFEVFKDPTTLAWKLWHHIFHPRWTGAIWKYSSPTHNYHHPPPFLPLYMKWRLSREIGSQAPLFSRARWKIREPGDKATASSCRWLKDHEWCTCSTSSLVAHTVDFRTIHSHFSCNFYSKPYMYCDLLVCKIFMLEIFV